MDLWHKRLAHLNKRQVKELANLVDGLDAQKATSLENLEKKLQQCEPCVMGKQTRTPSRIPGREDPFKRATEPGELIHTDIAGGGNITQTMGGKKFVFLLLDDATDRSEIHLLRRKGEAYRSLVNFSSK